MEFRPSTEMPEQRFQRRRKSRNVFSFFTGVFTFGPSGEKWRFGGLAFDVVFFIASANQEIGVPGRADLPIGISGSEANHRRPNRQFPVRKPSPHTRATRERSQFLFLTIRDYFANFFK